MQLLRPTAEASGLRARQQRNRRRKCGVLFATDERARCALAPHGARMHEARQPRQQPGWALGHEGRLALSESTIESRFTCATLRFRRQGVDWFRAANLPAKKRNSDFYDPLTTGDSSLSPSRRSSRLKSVNTDKAIQYGIAALLMDLADVRMPCDPPRKGGNTADSRTSGGCPARGARPRTIPAQSLASTLNTGRQCCAFVVLSSGCGVLR
jgi:hypothetical protein